MLLICQRLNTSETLDTSDTLDTLLTLKSSDNFSMSKTPNTSDTINISKSHSIHQTSLDMSEAVTTSPAPYTSSTLPSIDTSLWVPQMVSVHDADSIHQTLLTCQTQYCTPINSTLFIHQIQTECITYFKIHNLSCFFRILNSSGAGVYYSQEHFEHCLGMFDELQDIMELVGFTQSVRF